MREWVRGNIVIVLLGVVVVYGLVKRYGGLGEFDISDQERTDRILTIIASTGASFEPLPWPERRTKVIQLLAD